jgi:sigma-B regulation protein RsbU (phosphoserine phosphatase)
LLPNITFEQYQINFNKGDWVLTLSDGVRACPSLDLGMFGEKGFEELMHDLRDTKGAAFFGALIWNLTCFAESDDFPYDV